MYSQLIDNIIINRLCHTCIIDYTIAAVAAAAAAVAAAAATTAENESYFATSTRFLSAAVIFCDIWLPVRPTI